MRKSPEGAFLGAINRLISLVLTEKLDMQSAMKSLEDAIEGRSAVLKTEWFDRRLDSFGELSSRALGVLDGWSERMNDSQHKSIVTVADLINCSLDEVFSRRGCGKCSRQEIELFLEKHRLKK